MTDTEMADVEMMYDIASAAYEDAAASMVLKIALLPVHLRIPAVLVVLQMFRSKQVAFETVTPELATLPKEVGEIMQKSAIREAQKSFDELNLSRKAAS
jgi:hypothetical protein